MKKLLVALFSLLISCSDYSPTTYSDVVNKEYQENKLSCINGKLAEDTGCYGILGSVTRSTDGGIYTEWHHIYKCYMENAKEETDEIKDAWWVLLYNGSIYCDKNGGGQSSIDMTGFNANDPQGKCVYIPYSEQRINTSWCPNPSEHEPYFKYLTDGTYTFVEIHAFDSDGNDVICKVYSTMDYNPVSNDYLLCVEDLAGRCLDFNDVVILGGPNKRPCIIYRMASLPMTITYEGESYELMGDMYGEYNLELPFDDLDSPRRWINVEFTANGVNIPVLIDKIDDMPAVIATSVDYKFHRDEDSMTSSEFINIPFFGM